MASFVIFTRVQSQSLDYMCWTRFLSKFACEQHSALFVRTYVRMCQLECSLSKLKYLCTSEATLTRSVALSPYNCETILDCMYMFN